MISLVKLNALQAAHDAYYKLVCALTAQHVPMTWQAQAQHSISCQAYMSMILPNMHFKYPWPFKLVLHICH